MKNKFIMLILLTFQTNILLASINCDYRPQPFQLIKHPQIEHRLRCGSDWEPTVAASQSAWVHMISTTFDFSLCADNTNPICESNALVLRTSSNRGNSFSNEILPCDAICVANLLKRYPTLQSYTHNIKIKEERIANKTYFQYDPALHVCHDKNQTVLLTYLIGYIPGVVFQKSIDHGKTWSQPLPLGLTDHLLRTGGTDKPAITASESCTDIYAAFDGEDGNYMAVSHDSGNTFTLPNRTSPPVLPGDEYHDWFSPNSAVDAAGNIYFSQILNNEHNSDATTLAIVSSTDHGQNWKTKYLGKVPFPQQCSSSAGCSIGYLTPQVVIAAVGDQTAIAYTMPQKTSAPKKLYFLAHWQNVSLAKGIVLNDKGDSNFPMIIGGPKPCEFKVTWMDNRNGVTNKTLDTTHGPFNVYLKKTYDCGVTWSQEILLSNRSDATSVSYKHSLGFNLPYGDYSGLATNGFDDTFAVWGEGDTIPNNVGDAWFVSLK